MTGFYQTPHDFEDMLSKAQQEMRQLAEAAGDGEPPEGLGTAADGLMTVTAVNGRISAVTIDPRAMRLPSQDLAEAFAEAANAALTDLESKYPVPSFPPIDPARLEAQLAEAQELGTRQMRQYLQNITDAMGR